MIEDRKANNAFLKSVVHDIPGWPNDFTFACLMDILDLQADKGRSGSLLEIGVYAGRFCSVLARDAARRASHLVGIDPFLKFPLTEVRERLEVAIEYAYSLNDFQAPKITLMEDYSGNWTQDRLLKLLGERARFIHVDGSHLRADVLWDITLADSVMMPHGVIALDDFNNLQCMGVMEATFQFFEVEPRACVPFAYVGGKLLLCGRLYRQEYIERLEAFAASDKVYDISKRYQDKIRKGDTWMRQTFMGGDIIVLKH